MSTARCPQTVHKKGKSEKHSIFSCGKDGNNKDHKTTQFLSSPSTYSVVFRTAKKIDMSSKNQNWARAMSLKLGLYVIIRLKAW